MNPTQQILQRIENVGILPVASALRPEDAALVGNALAAGDIPSVLVPFTNERPEELIRAFSSSAPELLVGAEGIRSAEEARRAVDAGAQYLLIAFDAGLAAFCRDSGIAAFPVFRDFSELEAGADADAACAPVPPEGFSSIREFAKRNPGLRIIVDGFDPKNGRYWRQYGEVCAVRDEEILASSARTGGADDVASRARMAVMAMHDFGLLHVGVNCPDADRAMRAAKKMETLFGMSVRERPNSVFAGLGFEFMKKPDMGEKGHIALGTPNVARAAAYLEKKGIRSIPGTERYDDDGSLRRLYIDLDLEGFAVHLRKYPKI